MQMYKICFIAFY